jgi:hypothetical protein
VVSVVNCGQGILKPVSMNHFSIENEDYLYLFEEEDSESSYRLAILFTVDLMLIKSVQQLSPAKVCHI